MPPALRNKRKRPRETAKAKVAKKVKLDPVKPIHALSPALPSSSNPSRAVQLVEDVTTPVIKGRASVFARRATKLFTTDELEEKKDTVAVVAPEDDRFIRAEKRRNLQDNNNGDNERTNPSLRKKINSTTTTKTKDAHGKGKDKDNLIHSNKIKTNIHPQKPIKTKTKKAKPKKEKENDNQNLNDSWTSDITLLSPRIDYKCDECGNVFVYKHSLFTHKISVHEGRKWPCTKCDAKLSTKSHLNRHMRRMHRDDNGDNNEA